MVHKIYSNILPPPIWRGKVIVDDEIVYLLDREQILFKFYFRNCAGSQYRSYPPPPPYGGGWGGVDNKIGIFY